jgi:hypothetical protein
MDISLPVEFFRQIADTLIADRASGFDPAERRLAR